MIDVRQTAAFERWFRRLRDPEARAHIRVRIRRLSLGNPGGVRPIGEGIGELRVHWGPGYRVYYAHRGAAVVILLWGGDTRSQAEDVRTAMQINRRLPGES